MLRSVLVLAASLCALDPALAAEETGALAWSLEEGHSLRYVLQADVEYFEVLWMHAEFNHQGRVGRYALKLITTCTPGRPRGKRGWDLDCILDDVQVEVRPMPQDALPLAEVVQDWDRGLTGATVTLRLGQDGEVTSVDLEGVPKGNRRTNERQGQMRRFVTRAFAALDLQLPPGGTPGEESSWTDKESLSMGFVSDLGTLGSAKLVHTLEAEDDSGVVTLSSLGQGTLGSGEMVVIGESERPRNLFDMTLTGSARFDTSRGLLLERSYQVQGLPTSSSISADGVAGFPYLYAARARLLTPEQQPTLGESGFLE